MQVIRNPFPVAQALVATGSLALLTACSGSSSSSSPAPTPTPTTGTVSFLVTDAPTDSWADIGVIIRSIALVPKGQAESAAIQVYDGTQDTNHLNLVHLDGLAEYLSKASVTPGTYDRVLVKVDGDPATIVLAQSLDATGAPQNPIPASQILVNGTKDAKGWVNLPVIKLEADLVVTAGQATAVQLDFDLAHPLFVVTHDEVAPPVYSINFQVRHRPHHSLSSLVLRHHRGQVTSVATDASSFVLHTSHGADLTLKVDATNKTLFYDLDATPVNPVASTTVPAGLTVNKYAKVTARYQDDGSQWAARVWYSADASKLPTWTPEGHVVKVDALNKAITVLSDTGTPMKFSVADTTQFFFHGGTTAIGSGSAFLSNVSRGFKVHVTVADVLAKPMVAKEIDIQNGVYDGDLQNANATDFSYLKALWTQTETHKVGYDAAFTWWNFAYPATASSDKTAFIAKANAAGTNLVAHATSSLNWVNNAWVAKDAIFLPATVSMASQKVSSPYANGAMVIAYRYFLPDGTQVPATLTVNLNPTAGSQPIVTEFTRSLNGITVTRLDANAWAAKLVNNAKVRVYGIPKGDGTLDAYVVNLFD